MALGDKLKALKAYDDAIALGQKTGGKDGEEWVLEAKEARGILHKQLDDFDAAIGTTTLAVFDDVNVDVTPRHSQHFFLF